MTFNACNYTAAKPKSGTRLMPRIALQPTITAGTRYTGMGSGITL